MIAEPLLPLAADIDAIEPYPGNPRRGDISAIANSLQAFGQVKPLVVQHGTGYILAGNHTWHAAKKLGWTQVAVNRIDVDDATARRFLAADNHIPERGTYDDDELAALLQSIVDDDPDDGLTVTGYTNDDLASLTATDDNGGDGPAPQHSADLFDESAEDNYREQYAVMVVCTDEAHQEEVFNSLTSEGFNVKVVTT
ncbi:ParB N-terminal domain-containing protein [Streptomyces sp. NPDC102364]|uniref:ParB N-terminal domain-containing protein n=1 Tax=Streptomyces sp. NPDC102364 TaxID=3366161 RepID=UPI00382D87C1